MRCGAHGDNLTISAPINRPRPYCSQRGLRAHFLTCECAVVHTSASPPAPPPQSLSDQTPRSTEYKPSQCPLKTHIFSLWVSSAELARPQSAHTLRSGVHDAAHSQSRRRVHQAPLGHNTRLVHHCHTTLAVCMPSTAAPCTSVRTGLGQGNNTTASPLGSQVFPSRFSTPPSFSLLHPKTERAATGPHAVSSQNWPLTLQNRILEESKMSQCYATMVCGLRADSGMTEQETSHKQARHAIPPLSQFEFRALAVRKDMKNACLPHKNMRHAVTT